jgi:hypothetical protein
MTKRERALYLLAYRRVRAMMRSEVRAAIAELDGEIDDLRDELHEAQRHLGQLRLLDMTEGDEGDRAVLH